MSRRQADEVPAEAVERLAAEQGPRWRSRKEAWLDGYRNGEQQARMTGVATATIRKQRDAELRQRLEERFGGANLQRALAIFEETK